MLVLLAYICIGRPMLNILAGFSAKALCSCHFISDRTVRDIVNHELSIATWANHAIDNERQIASTSALGVTRHALYREGRGCTLASEVDVNDLMSSASYSYQRDVRPFEFPLDTLDTSERLNMIMNNAFAEPYEDKKVNTRAVVVIKGGKLIAERYAPGYNQDTPQMGWSMTKSVINALMGILVGQGTLDIYAPARIPEWYNQTQDPRQDITIDHLLRMSSGLYFEEDYSSASTVNQMLWTKADAALEAYSQTLAYEPDSLWYYASGTTNIISKIIRNQFQDDASYLSFPYKYLFDMIGMSTAVMETDASGTYVGSSLMYASARDWAKFGQLYLNDGIWEGKRILPEGWVAYSSTPSSTTAPYDFYGAQFWLNAKHPAPKGSGYPEPWTGVPSDAYYASGFEGQTVLIIPSIEMIIVRLGQTLDRSLWDMGAFAAAIIQELD